MDEGLIIRSLGVVSVARSSQLKSVGVVSVARSSQLKSVGVATEKEKTPAVISYQINL
jgi:hypothetical protein